MASAPVRAMTRGGRSTSQHFRQLVFVHLNQSRPERGVRIFPDAWVRTKIRAYECVTAATLITNPTHLPRRCAVSPVRNRPYEIQRTTGDRRQPVISSPNEPGSDVERQ